MVDAEEREGIASMGGEVDQELSVVIAEAVI